MDISIGRVGAWTVVTASGEVDLHCSGELRGALLSCLDSGEPVLIDLSGISYIDSSGLAALVVSLGRARESEVGLGLVRPSEAVLRLLRLSKLDTVFAIYDSAHDAPDG